MKKFILNVVAVLVLSIAVLAAASAWYEAQDVPTNHARTYRAMPAMLDVANTGTSHGELGYDYSDRPQYAAFNFAMSGQNLSYDWRLLTNYQDRFKPGSAIFITVSYHAISVPPETEATHFKSKNIRYYGVLPASLIKNYELSYAIRGRWLTILAAQTNILRALVGSGVEVDVRGLSTDVDAAARDRDHLIDDHRAKELDRCEANAEEVAAIYDMIEICRKHDARPILVTPPFLAEYTESFERGAPHYLPFFYGVIDEIVRKTGVEYFDYSHDERFMHDYSLFMDSHHLNRNGALKFTKIIMDRVGLR